MREGTLRGGPERLLCDCVTGEPGFASELWDVWQGTLYTGSGSKREKGAAVSKAGKSNPAKSFDIKPGAVGMWSLFCWVSVLFRCNTFSLCALSIGMIIYNLLLDFTVNRLP